MTDWPDTAQTDPAAEVESAERRAHLYAALDHLPESYRLLVLLRFQQGLAYEEIAMVTSLPLGTVKTGLHRARARLKDALRSFDDAGDAHGARVPA